MKVYFDSALLVKSYVEEEISLLADALLMAEAPPVVFTELHGLKVRTALRLKLIRGELTAAELTGALETLQTDVAAALELDVDAFASLDKRKREVAHKAGLKLLPKTLPARGRK